MNREQKIALIVGFAVVLVVGVLVSDHLSGARQLEIADATEGDMGRVEPPVVALLPDPVLTSTPARASEEFPSLPDTSYALEADPTQEETVRPLRLALGGQGDVSPLGEVLRDLGGDSAAPVLDDQPAWQDRIMDLGQRFAAGVRNGVPEAARVDNPPVTARPEQARPREVEPSRVRHTVAKDESLFKIAKRYLGDGNRWREIAAANEGKVGDDGSVRAGVTLVIPSASAPAPSPQPQTPRARPQDPSPNPVRYTVKKNDSLSEIAQKYLGTVKRMDEIIAANRGLIDDPDDIRVGMVLTIPARS